MRQDHYTVLYSSLPPPLSPSSPLSLLPSLLPPGQRSQAGDAAGSVPGMLPWQLVHRSHIQPGAGPRLGPQLVSSLVGLGLCVCVCVLPGSWGLYELTNHRLAVCKWSVRTMSHTISWDHSTLCSVFSPLCIRRNANTRSIQSLGTLSLLTPSLRAHPHTLTVGTRSLWAHPHSSHPHCGHTLTRSHTHVHLCDPPLTPSLLPSYLPHCVPGLGGPSVYAPSLPRERAAEFIPITLPPPP